MDPHRLSIGIDVSKHQLDYAAHDRTHQGHASNTAAGVTALVETLRALAPERIVVESTGGYERTVARALADAALPVVVVNPRAVRHFAKALGVLAKTDTLDAAVLAQYGATLKPQPRATRSDAEQAMADLMARRRQLFAMIVMEKNRLAAPVRALTRRIEAHIRWLEREVKSTDALLDAWIAADPERSAQVRILESVPGVGTVVAKTLITDLPEPAASASARSRRWSASPPSIATAARCAADGTCAEGAPRSVASCTWPPSPGAASTRCSRPSTRACSPPASRRSSPSPPSPTSC